MVNKNAELLCTMIAIYPQLNVTYWSQFINDIDIYAHDFIGNIQFPLEHA